VILECAVSVAFCCGSGAWCRVWHIPGRCRQPPAASARSRSGCRSHPSLASQNQARSSRSAPAAARGRGAPNVAGRPPGPRSAPLAPATGRSPPPRLQSSAPRLRHRLPSSPRACGPRAAAAAHHFGSCLAFVASSLQSAARASRSQRVRSRQGILPVKTLGGGVLRVVEVPFAQTFDGSPP
jgi:hypothetical protein